MSDGENVLVIRRMRVLRGGVMLRMANGTYCILVLYVTRIETSTMGGFALGDSSPDYHDLPWE